SARWAAPVKCGRAAAQHTSARRVLGQELFYGFLRRRLVFGLFPEFDERGVRRQRRGGSGRGVWMVQIIAQQYQQGRLTARDKLARYVEEKIAAVHGLLEGFPGRRAHVRARGPELIRPAVEHLEEGLAVVVQADGLKHDGRSPELGRPLVIPHVYV